MRSKTQSMFFALAAGAAASLSIVAAAGPAAARGPSVASIAPKATSGSAPIAKKICMKTEPMTGSRLSRQECRTRAEWEADGFTVTTRAKAKAAGQR